MAVINILDTGAAGDGIKNDTAAVQSAIDLTAHAGGGTVIIPGGYTFRCAALRLKSHVHINLEPGSTLLASTVKDDYNNSLSSCLLEAEGAVDVSVSGGGTVHGQCSAYITEDLGYIYKPADWRPGLLFFLDCRRITIKETTFTESPWWTLHLVGCEDVLIQGIRIYNSLKMPNCDGIDPDHCRFVRIAGCHIQCADDCIVLKNTEKYADRGECSHITITGCTLMCTAAAVKIGTESVCDFKHITVSACTIKSSSRGISLHLRDQGNIENVTITNCSIETRLFDNHFWGQAEPVYISAVSRFSSVPGKTGPNSNIKTGHIRNIIISDITARSENGIFIYSEEEEGIRNILLHNIILSIDKWSRWPGGKMDLRPSDGPAHALRSGCGDPGVTAHPFSGCFIKNAAGITLDCIHISWGTGLPDYYTHALFARNSPGLIVNNFPAESAHPEKYSALDIL